MFTSVYIASPCLWWAEARFQKAETYSENYANFLIALLAEIKEKERKTSPWLRMEKD